MVCQTAEQTQLSDQSVRRLRHFLRMQYKRTNRGASLVAQWLRICLPMQGTRVRALVWEDPTCRGATRPVSHSYWACPSGACAPQQERPQQWEARAPRWRVAPTRHNQRKPSHRNPTRTEDPTQPKINKYIFKKKKKKEQIDTEGKPQTSQIQLTGSLESRVEKNGRKNFSKK